MITETETGILRDVFQFLRSHSDPPPRRSPACAPGRLRAGTDAAERAERHGNHDRVLQRRATVLCWLERKMEGKA